MYAKEFKVLHSEFAILWTVVWKLNSNEAFASRVTFYCPDNSREQQYWRTICRCLMFSGDTCHRLLTPALVWNIHRHSHEAQSWFQIILTTVLNYVNILILKSLMQCYNCIRMSKVWIAKISYLVLDSLHSCEGQQRGSEEEWVQRVRRRNNQTRGRTLRSA